MTKKREEWKPVIGYDGLYEVSSYGRVRSLDREVKHNNQEGMRTLKGKVLTFGIYRDGRHVVNLSRNGITRQRKVSHIVAESFIGPRPQNLCVLHEDGDCTNDHVDNLYYGTHQQNTLDAIRHKTALIGECNGQAKLTEDDVRYIRSQRGIMTQKSLAKIFDVSREQVRDIQLRKVWKHV